MMATSSSVAIELEPLAPPTLEDLVRVIGIPPIKLDEPCSDEHLRDISSDLTCWQELAPYLDLKEAEVEVIELDAKTVNEKRLKALRKWKNKYGFRATYRALTEALLKCHMADHAEKVCRLLVPNPLEPRHDSEPVQDKNGAMSTISTSRYTEVSVLEVPSEDRAQNLYDEIHELEKKFENLEDEVEDSLTKAGTDLSRVKNRIIRLPVSLKHSHWDLLDPQSTKDIQSTKNIGELFTLLHNRHWDFLNCEVLCHIVDRFGDVEIKQSTEKYLDELRRFRTKTKLRDLIRWTGTRYANYLPVEKHLVLKMGEEWRDRTLEDLEQFRIELSRRSFINSYAMQFRKGEPGCIAVTFALPTSVDITALCLQKLVDFFQQHNVLRIMADGSCILDTTIPKVGFEQSSAMKEEEPPQLPEKTTATPTLPGAEEVGIIGNKFVFLAERLPLDDIAPMMLERKLVTAREYAGYHIRKTAPEKSEYLLECLKRRPAGSLKVFCDILREIEPAAHLAKLLEQSTKAQGMSFSKASGEEKVKGNDQEDLVALAHSGLGPDDVEEVEQPLSPMSLPVFTLYDNMRDMQRLLDVESVYPYLFSAGCITAEDVEHLKTFHHNRNRMVVELAYLISKKRGKGLRTFMAALEQSSDHPGHHELLTILQQSIRRRRQPIQHIELVIAPPQTTRDLGAEGEPSTETLEQQQLLATSSPPPKKNVFTVPMLIHALRRVWRKLNLRGTGTAGAGIADTAGRICCATILVPLGVSILVTMVLMVVVFVMFAIGSGPTLIITGSIGLQGDLSCNLTSDNTTEIISLSSLSICSVLLGVSFLSFEIVFVGLCFVGCCIQACRFGCFRREPRRCYHCCCCLLGVVVGLCVISFILSVVMAGCVFAEYESISDSYGGNIDDICNPTVYYSAFIIAIGIIYTNILFFGLFFCCLYCTLFVDLFSLVGKSIVH